MKKTIYILCVVAVTMLTHQSKGQNAISKGQSMLGGGLNLSFRDNDSGTSAGNDFSSTSHNKSFSISPYYGRFIKDNLLIGGGLGISVFDSDGSSNAPDFSQESSSNGHGYTIKAFIRKYFPLGEKVGAYLEGSLNYNRHENNRDFSSIDLNTNEILSERKTDELSDQFSLQGQLGLYYFFSPKFSLETNLLNIVLSRNLQDREQMNVVNQVPNSSSQTTTSFALSLINELSFDKILTINYFF